MNEVVNQANDLIRNRVDEKEYLIDKANRKAAVLTVSQKKLILYGIAKIKPTDLEFSKVEISLVDFCRMMNIKKGGRTFFDIKKELEALARIKFWIDGKSKSKLCSWLSDEDLLIDYNKSFISFKLSNTLAPYLINLKNNFTAYEIGYTMNFRGKYTYRLYEYLRSYLHQGVYLFPVEKFISEICDEKYKAITDIERWVLKKSVQEINDFSDINVYYKKIHKFSNRRSKTTHFYFEINEKSEEEKSKIIATWEEILQPADEINGQLTFDIIATQKSEREKLQLEQSVLEKNPDLQKLKEKGYI